MIYLANAFSLNMLFKPNAIIGVREMPIRAIKQIIEDEFTSAIGHESTAKLLSKILGVEVPVNRVKIILNENDSLIVFQLTERLPEGKILSDEEIGQLFLRGKAKFFIVTVLYL